MPEDVNIHVRAESGLKTETLRCNWCHQPHPVEPAYKAEVLARGAEKIAEIDDPDFDLAPEDTWTCGKCMIYLMGLPETMRTECHDHEVPRRT